MNPNRRFLYEILGSGLELETVTPEDVLRHVTPEILAHHLPVTLKAKLLEASLSAEKMSAGLIVEVVGVEALAEHSPVAALWACLAEAARRALADDSGVLHPGIGAGLVGASHGGDAEAKPNKSARPSTVRTAGRVSALSPRSRQLGTAPGLNSGLGGTSSSPGPSSPLASGPASSPLVAPNLAVTRVGGPKAPEPNAFDMETKIRDGGSDLEILDESDLTGDRRPFGQNDDETRPGDISGLGRKP